MGIINMIKSFFKSKTDDRDDEQETRRSIVEPDFIDYDGMGNQGRFPTTKQKRK